MQHLIMIKHTSHLTLYSAQKWMRSGQGEKIKKRSMLFLFSFRIITFYQLFNPLIFIVDTIVVNIVWVQHLSHFNVKTASIFLVFFLNRPTVQVLCCSYQYFQNCYFLLSEVSSLHFWCPVFPLSHTPRFPWPSSLFLAVWTLYTLNNLTTLNYLKKKKALCFS